MTEQKHELWMEEGGPEFPSQVPDHWFKGMTLRDYFAAKAMDVVWLNIPEDVNRQEALKYLGENAYEMADAMLKARAE